MHLTRTGPVSLAGSLTGCLSGVAGGPIAFNYKIYRRQMKEPLKKAHIEWEGWHGFRRGLATNLDASG
jgi:hypothetical protein